MRALVAVILISFLPLTTFAAVSTGPYELVSDRILGNLNGNINVPFYDASAANSAAFTPIDPTKAAGLDVAGATGALTHPACVAETARRAAMDPPQPPPNGDFPCVVPASNGAGVVDGVCFVKVCRGVSFTGLGGIMSAVSSIASLASTVGGILARLLQGSPSTPSGGGGDFGSTTAREFSPAPQPLSTGSLQTPDMSKLLSDSAAIVAKLGALLNPPPTQ